MNNFVENQIEQEFAHLDLDQSTIEGLKKLFGTDPEEYCKISDEVDNLIEMQSIESCLDRNPFPTNIYTFEEWLRAIHNISLQDYEEFGDIFEEDMPDSFEKSYRKYLTKALKDN